MPGERLKRDFNPNTKFSLDFHSSLLPFDQDSESADKSVRFVSFVYKVHHFGIKVLIKKRVDGKLCPALFSYETHDDLRVENANIKARALTNSTHQLRYQTHYF